jgi:serine/threonine-protein kinase
VTDVPDRLRRALSASYRIERELGAGGMATVYLAHDLKHQRAVALKVLHPDLAHALGPDRFRREVEIAARLTHPHILTVFDSGDADGMLWYTMPFVDGESLRDMIARERELPLETVLRIMREVADALDYAHAQGVVHRDIKPENILLSRGHALVADFGIARALHQESGRLTATGLAVGTPAYMSPEQGSGRVRPAAVRGRVPGARRGFARTSAQRLTDDHRHDHRRLRHHLAGIGGEPAGRD